MKIHSEISVISLVFILILAFMPGKIGANMFLDMLYGSLAGTTVVRPLFVATSVPTKIAGGFANSRLSQFIISRFASAYGANTEEMEFPLEEYTTLNDFFSRRLKPGSRPIAEGEDIFISPADGHVTVIENLSLVTQLPLKGSLLDLEKCLGSKALADMFMGGTAIIVRITPGDYHRYHIPCDAQVKSLNIIHGKFDSVDPIAYSWVQPLQTNERHLLMLQTDRFNDVGMLAVGALFVGSMEHLVKVDDQVKKGEEGGFFKFGGSTIVVFLRPGIVKIDARFLADSATGNETPIKMGQRLGERVSQ